MAQTKKSTTKSSTARSGSRAKSTGGSARAASKRSTANGKKPTSTKASRPRSQTRSKPQSRSKAQSRNGAAPVTDTAIQKTKAAGQSVAEVGSKLKTPLIAAGTAIAGVAAGVLVKDRLGAKRSKNPLKRMGGVSIPTPNLGKLDLGKFKSAAERVSAYGQQASDIAKAVEKTQKKNK